MKVAVVIGSKSDLEVVRPTLEVLGKFGVKTETRIISAHRTPEEAHEFASTAYERGVEVVVAVAGKAAHLAGVIASSTILPVIALPVQTSMMGGLDSLLSMVQMPSGIPVATVGVNAGENAGLLAVQILSLKYPALSDKLLEYKQQMREKIKRDDEQLQKELKA